MVQSNPSSTSTAISQSNPTQVSTSINSQQIVGNTQNNKANQGKKSSLS
jgi:hypothetical protein